MTRLTKIISITFCLPILLGTPLFGVSAGDKGYQELLQAAIDNPLRAESDRLRDENRKPAQVIEFMGIKPGMVVMEFLAGAGYYADILSTVVGTDGKVIALNNAAYMEFTKNAIKTRMDQPGRMDNVTLSLAEVNDMSLAKNSLDVIFLILGYHDFYFVDEKGGWPKVKVDRTLSQLFQSLKKGGVLAIIDHAAVSGSPRETGSTLHRIDPEIVKSELIAAGFTLEAESDILANPEDDMTKPMFDKSVRGKTNRFVFRFVKP